MKNKAFTLLEVLVALLILVSAVIIFSSVNFRAFSRSSKERAFLDRVFIIQEEFLKFLLDIENKKKKKEIKIIEDPEINISSKILDLDKKSSLKKFIGNVKILKTNGSWVNFSNKNNLGFIAFVRLKADKKDK